MLIVNTTIITGDANRPLIQDGAIAIEGTKIAAVGNLSDLKDKYPELEEFDAKGSVIAPGLVNAHMHLYSSLARGMPPPSSQPKNFVEVLEKIWWRLDKALNMEDLYLSAMVGLIESAKAGVTTVIDHHSSPNAIGGSLTTIANAVGEVGMRGVLCYEVSDRDGEKKRDEGIKENSDFITASKNNSGSCAGIFGLHASFTLSDATLKSAVEANNGKRFHIHVGEDAADIKDSLDKYGVSVVKRLTSLGILNSDSIAAHCVHLAEGDLRLLKESGVLVTHQPQSNANNAVGRAPIPELVKAGVKVGLGTDSYTYNLLEEAHFALLNHNKSNGGPLSINNLNQMLSENAKAASAYLGVKLGTITEGAEADLALYNYNSPTPLTEDNVSSHRYYGLRSMSPHSVISGGELIVEDYRMTKLKEDDIMNNSRKAASALWGRM
ncbi:MAG: putative aminohydrolase SsnA [Candidatus Marinimicrobia bacterium]|nr:putative aminohydrolase SsnA [Candidatus Neomarinimicrobiota bacterium]